MGDVATATAIIPTTTTAASPLELNQPNATLYVSNIDWKIKKLVLRRALHTLFGRHGKILEIITLRHEGLRGQAWIIFSHLPAATAALQSEQGFAFFGKNLKVAYARETSDRIAKTNGTYVPKDRREKRERRAMEVEASKRAKVEASTMGDGGEDGLEGGVTVEDPASLVVGEDVVANEGTEPTTADVPSSSITTAPIIASENPSNILFADSLPADCKEMMLAMLFRQYAGFKEVRVPRPGLAFVEFDDESHATVALTALNGFKLTASDTLNLRYGKS
eukprot:CAMPEP_0198271800 /NCGR_PEP_ID=MMETSP1447-20131203/50662_1 /TAXON_ID=420782 /ORGANISM="Chaetoceros dichaeta, Strain CCMP1751" /LENGTH=277 /DNA_ID=CAMNT_0043964607 /DNA_START=22 /DNA_END=855 /DNA_ORIENTATION=+